MKRTGPTNQNLRKLIEELKKTSIETDAALWKRTAVDLEKPTRKRIVINLSRIARATKENETILVPGKILAAGTINHKLVVAAYQFSKEAKEKIEANGGKTLTISQLLKQNPEGTNVKIMG